MSLVDAVKAHYATEVMGVPPIDQQGEVFWRVLERRFAQLFLEKRDEPLPPIHLFGSPIMGQTAATIKYLELLFNPLLDVTARRLDLDRADLYSVITRAPSGPNMHVYFFCHEDKVGRKVFLFEEINPRSCAFESEDALQAYLEGLFKRILSAF